MSVNIYYICTTGRFALKRLFDRGGRAEPSRAGMAYLPFDSGGSRDRRERRAPVPHTSSTTGSARFIDSHVSFGLTCTCVSCMNSSSGTLARQFGTKHTSLSWTTSVLR